VKLQSAERATPNFTFQDCQDGTVTAPVVWLSSLLGGGIHDRSSIQHKPFGSLLSDYGKPRVCSDLPTTL